MDARLDTIQYRTMSCPMFQAKAHLLVKGNYPTSFPLKHMAKGLKFVLDKAHEMGLQVPAAQVTMSMIFLVRKHSLGDMDFAAVDKTMSKILKKYVLRRGG